MPLPENRRTQLDGIVKQMIANQEKDSDIKLVVDDFVSKYQNESVIETPQPKKDLLQKTGDVVNKIFPGKQVGEAIGTLAGYALSKDKKNYSLNAPKPLQVAGDIASGGAMVAGLKVPSPTGVLAKAGQLAGLSALGGAGGSAAGGGGVKDILKSAFISGTIGAGISLVASGAGKAISSLTKKAPAKIYNTTIKTPLQDTKKAILYKGETLGQDLVKRGIKGSDEGLFKQAISQIDENEDKLQSILSKSKHVISRGEIEPYLDDLISTKQATPGLLEDAEKVRAILKEFPEEIPIAEANQIKRNLYRALDDIAFKIDPNLSTKKEAMKAIAKGIKTEIENKTAGEAGVDVVKNINKELQVFGALKNRTLDKIARLNKNNLLGLGDMFAIGSGATIGAVTGGSSIVGAGVVEGLKRASQSTRVMTNVAVGLDKLGKLVNKLPTDSAGRISKTSLIQLMRKLSEN